ncbi:MAG: class I tRNA ligase family protein, partial [Candidatus Pacebacteria bacterium]|nr:class I tRNA ligase family protein [Candidatus Paceibacterota bacterium]
MNEKAKSINEKELEVLKFWNDNKIFQKSLEKPAGESFDESFTFYDGPPFATGMPHHGHLLAGTIKDTIPRFHTMNGKHVRRVWGWDCHGLPIENLIEKKFNLNSKKDIEEFGIEKFNKAAEESVFTYEKEWKEIVPRFGRWVDMENSYKTMDANYTESVWWAFSELFKKGLVYEGKKSMHICPRCETTLAQSEVSLAYKDLTDISITVKFELEDEPNTFVLAWTTTPWTIPGNVALAINKEFEYVKVEATKKENKKTESFILAKDRFEKVFEVFKDDFEDIRVIDTFSGEKLIGKKYKAPFFVRSILEANKIVGDADFNFYKIWDAEFVTLDTGTGVVHIAPMFGEDDNNLAKKYNLPRLRHVNMDGSFDRDVIDELYDKDRGIFVKADESTQLKEIKKIFVKTKDDNQGADILMIKYLAKRGLLFSKEKIIHSYPTCWRCETPLLNYATSSWFIDVPKIKDKLLSENKNIEWIPENIRDGRFGKWLEGAREWAVSRSRYWGAPIPIWKEIGGEEIKVIGSIKELADLNINKQKNEYYIIRHGEAGHNVEGIEDTEMDPNNHLTELGKTQVMDTKKRTNVDFDLIVSSPYLRTIETAELMSNGQEIIIDENFREIELGIYNKQKGSKIFEDLGISYLKFNTKIGGGESHGDVMNRMMRGIYNLEEKYVNKKILIVTHGAPMRMAQTGAKLLTEENLIKDELSNNIILYPRNAEIRKLDIKIIPRDEKGKINLHRPYIDNVKILSSSGKEMERVEYVFDCWFESGSMPYGQFHYPFENKELFEKNFPADFIAEGLDQTRGWFYSLLNISVGLFDKSAYKNVIVNGLLLAADGEKMSKSKNNYTDPMVLVEKFGADAFRHSLLSSSVMCAENIPFSDSNVEESYKKIISKLENVFSFFEMINDKSIFAKVLSTNKKDITNDIDIWILTRLNEILVSTTKAMNNYRLDTATRSFEKFIDDLSTWWLRRSRERLKGEYGNTEEEKLNNKIISQYILHTTLNDLSRIIAPFMPFIAERVYQGINIENAKKRESVHLESWPTEFLKIDQDILKEMEIIRELVQKILFIRQNLKINVRQPMGRLILGKDYKTLSEDNLRILIDEVNFKAVEIDEDIAENKYEEGAKWLFHKFDKENTCSSIIIDKEITPTLKREGDYRELVRKIKDIRKENNLTPNDLVSLNFETNKNRIDFVKSFEEDLKKDCKLSEIKFTESEKEEIVLQN